MQESRKKIFLNHWLYEISQPARTRLLLGTALFILAFLLLFRPFHLDSSPPADLLATAFISSLTYLLVGLGLNQLRSRGLWIDANRPLLAECCYLVLLMTLVGFIIFTWRVSIDAVDRDLETFLQFQLFALLMAALVLPASRLFHVFSQTMAELQTRASMVDVVDSAGSESQPEAVVRIPLSDEEGEFELQLAEWVYGKSAGNYVEMFILGAAESGLRSVLLRTTLKNIHEAMAEQVDFCQIHRSYVVNLAHASTLIGNAQSRRLRLSDDHTVLPVSRSFESELQRYFGESGNNNRNSTS